MQSEARVAGVSRKVVTKQKKDYVPMVFKMNLPDSVRRGSKAGGGEGVEEFRDAIGGTSVTPVLPSHSYRTILYLALCKLSLRYVMLSLLQKGDSEGLQVVEKPSSAPATTAKKSKMSKKAEEALALAESLRYVNTAPDLLPLMNQVTHMDNELRVSAPPCLRLALPCIVLMML